MTVKTLLIEYDDTHGDGMGGYPLHAPAVDVVRCRECRHFTPKGTHVFSDGVVNDDFCHYIRSWMLQVSPDGFCAWGERSGEE